MVESGPDRAGVRDGEVGGLFLGEAVTLPMLVGGGVILAGTSLVLGLLPRRPKAATA